MFLDGDSFQPFCVAVVNVKVEPFKRLAASLKLTGTFAELCSSKAMNKELLARMREFAKGKKLLGFQQPLAIYIEQTPFQDLSLMTITSKLQRYQARNYFKDMTKQLSESLAKHE